MKYVLVTGAYGGMGRRSVEMLKSMGYTVFALDRQVGKAEENVIPLRADVTSEQSIAEAFEAVRTVTDELYAIVHYAGVYMLDSLVEMESGEFDKIFDINVRGVFLINKTFLPLLKLGSKIVITTSELAPLDPLPFTGIYAVTKGALDKYAYSLRMELQLLGISVSVLRAGAVDTGMIDVSMTALDRFCSQTKLYSCNAERFKAIVERVEARKVSPDRIAQRVRRILNKKAPRFVYTLNRNPLLLLLNALPKALRFKIIAWILK